MAIIIFLICLFAWLGLGALCIYRASEDRINWEGMAFMVGALFLLIPAYFANLL